MSFKRYRQFIAVAEELHFGRAAERLNIAQPQLSQSLKMLERDLGAKLVDRTHSRVALTPAGHAFLEEARRCVLYGERAERVARSIASGEGTKLRIGFSALILNMLSSGLKKFWAQNAQSEISLEEAGSVVQLRKLRDGDLDLGLIELNSCKQPEDTVAIQRLCRHPYVAVIPASWPEARKPRIRLGDLARRDFILFPYARMPHIHQAIFTACRAAGFEPRVIQEARRALTAVSLVASELGVALIPDAGGTYGIRGVVLRPIDDLPAEVCADMAMAWIPPATSHAQRQLMEAIAATASSTAEVINLEEARRLPGHPDMQEVLAWVKNRGQ
jgi:DNA-binding transcriptional LysR family regulator